MLAKHLRAFGVRVVVAAATTTTTVLGMRMVVAAAATTTIVLGMRMIVAAATTTTTMLMGVLGVRVIVAAPITVLVCGRRRHLPLSQHSLCHRLRSNVNTRTVHRAVDALALQDLKCRSGRVLDAERLRKLEECRSDRMG